MNQPTRQSHRPILVLAALLLAACDSTPTDPDPMDPPDPPASCEDVEGLSLAVGEVVDAEGSAARVLCVGAGGADEEFVLVTSFGAVPAGDPLPLRVLGEGTMAPAGSPSPVPALSPMAQLERPGFRDGGDLDLPMPDPRFHAELRERERRELGPLVGEGGAAPGSPAPSMAAQPPDEGSLVSLNAQSASACEDPLYVTGRVEVVSERAVVVADTANPSGGFGSSDFRHYAATFDTLLAPLAEENFGEPSDIDGNGRTIIFFTQEVNRLTPPGSESLTTGFFFSRDLFPRGNGPQRLQACDHSNEAEILYLLVPDPEGEVNNNARSMEYLRQITPGTLIHEHQHLINASRRLHVFGLSGLFWEEETWLNEALSHTAEELLFFEVSGLEPGENIGVEAFTSGGSQVQTAMSQFQLFNFLRFREFLEAPGANSPYNPADLLPTRGASWSLLRYVVDRHGSDPSTFYSHLVDSGERGISNLAGRIGDPETFFDWLADWTVAIYADERVPNLAERHRSQSWNLPEIHQITTGPRASYPIRVDGVGPGPPATRSVVPGGAAYFRFGVPAGEVGMLEVTEAGERPPSTLRARLLRIR